MRRGLVKVTIVGYYPISEDEIENYDVEEYDLAVMAKIDSDTYHRDREDAADVIDWFLDGKPTSVTFEPVSMDGVDPEC